MEAAPPPITPDFEFEWGPSSSAPTASAAASPKQARTSPYLSPPLIAMLAVVGAAFLIVLYARILSHLLRRWRRRLRRRRLLRTTTATTTSYSSSPGPFDASSSSDYFLSPYGLDAAAITTLPLSLFSNQSKCPNRDCAVCLLEFASGEPLRTLPLCSHAFHADCIDAWLRSHASCPLCRAAVFPFVPMRAARIRPDLTLFESAAAAADDDEPEITAAIESPRDWFLKRSYSFGFERTERMVVMETGTGTASPWRYRNGRGFWSKRWPSPFGGSASGMTGGRVFSFRRSGMMVKSPFMRRRGWFQPLPSSEPRMMGGWSRRSRSMASPSAIFNRAAAASSRMRCGDPEALVSPERLNRR